MPEKLTKESLTYVWLVDQSIQQRSHDLAREATELMNYNNSFLSPGHFRPLQLVRGYFVIRLPLPGYAPESII